MRWGKGSETPSFPRSEHEERGSLRPLFPSQEGVSDPFSHRKRETSYIPKIPLAQIPLVQRIIFLASCNPKLQLPNRGTILTHSLSGPYCAILRDYLSDTPLLRAMGFLVSQHGQWGAIPPPPSLSVSPLESMRNGGAIPPTQRGISAILARYHTKASKKGAIPPPDTISTRY